jgi:hypothetical protein
MKTNHNNSWMQELTQDLSNYLVNKLQSMSGDRSIDEIVEFYLKKIGATNTQILGKPLLGIEGNTIVIADFKDMHIRTIVLVKHWLKEADESVIKQIVDAKSNYGTPNYTPILWVVEVCNHFTERAQKLADENDVRLITDNEFARLLLDVGFGTLDL